MYYYYCNSFDFDSSFSIEGHNKEKSFFASPFWPIHQKRFLDVFFNVFLTFLEFSFSFSFFFFFTKLEKK